jgi:hypothetical protein
VATVFCSNSASGSRRRSSKRGAAAASADTSHRAEIHVPSKDRILRDTCLSECAAAAADFSDDAAAAADFSDDAARSSPSRSSPLSGASSLLAASSQSAPLRGELLRDARANSLRSQIDLEEEAWLPAPPFEQTGSTKFPPRRSRVSLEPRRTLADQSFCFQKAGSRRVRTAVRAWVAASASAKAHVRSIG